MDLVTSSSRTEAFPLAIGEAMSCGTPCVVTDVGDSGALVSDTGSVVPPQDAAALASAWGKFFESGRDYRDQCGRAARSRIQQLFSLKRTVERYERLYMQAVAGTRAAIPA